MLVKFEKIMDKNFKAGKKAGKSVFGVLKNGGL